MTTHGTLPRERANGHGQPSSIRSLDDLARLSSRELRQVFSGGTVPASMAALDGDLAGRMLAFARIEKDRRLPALASVAQSQRFPWLGKTFRSADATHGHGENRVRLLRPRRVVPFETRFGTSVLDGRPCIVFDYRAPIHDELREVGPGIFLGPACLKRPRHRRASAGPANSGSIVVVWFALERSSIGA